MAYRFLFDALAPDKLVAFLRGKRFPLKLENNVFAYHHFQMLPAAIEDGWRIYDAEREAERLGLVPANGWRLSHGNDDFQLCPSYPRLLVVPEGITYVAMSPPLGVGERVRGRCGPGAVGRVPARCGVVVGAH